MIVRRTNNLEDVKKIIFDQFIINETSKGMNIDIGEIEKVLPHVKAEYIGCYVDNEIIGLMVYNNENDSQLNCHFNVLKEFRYKYGIEFCKKALLYGIIKGKSINAIIPNSRNSVINFSKRFGFKEKSKTNEETLLRLDYEFYR